MEAVAFVRQPLDIVLLETIKDLVAGLAVDHELSAVFGHRPARFPPSYKQHSLVSHRVLHQRHPSLHKRAGSVTCVPGAIGYKFVESLTIFVQAPTNVLFGSES